jgi:hypothetical protein
MIFIDIFWLLYWTYQSSYTFLLMKPLKHIEKYCHLTHVYIICVWSFRKNKNEDTLKHLLKTVPEQGIKYELKLCIDRLVSKV